MDQKNLLTQTLDFIQGRRRYRRWLRAVTAMAAVVVFVTTYLLILPAITKEHGLMEVEAANKEAALGENITAGIYAAAAGDGEETFFVLNISGDNAGLDERTLNFNSDGVAVLRDENGKKIELHREYQEDASVLLWFTLGQGQSSSFELPWVNGVDRFHCRVTEEKVPVISKQGETEEATKSKRRFDEN